MHIILAETADPMRMNWPVLAWMVRMFVVSTAKPTLSPWLGEAGSVAVAVPVTKYPLFTAAAKLVASSVQVEIAPEEEIVMLLEPLTIDTPAPAVSVAAAGTPAVDPMMSWPSVANAVMTGVPVAPVVRTPRLAVARPETTLAAEE